MEFFRFFLCLTPSTPLPNYTLYPPRDRSIGDPWYTVLSTMLSEDLSRLNKAKLYVELTVAQFVLNREGVTDLSAANFLGDFRKNFGFFREISGIFQL